MNTMQASLSRRLLYPTKVRYIFFNTKGRTDALGPVIYKNETVIISNPTEFPDSTQTVFGVKDVQEPVVKASIIVPQGHSLNIETFRKIC
jgi:hypothetical protein